MGLAAVLAGLMAISLIVLVATRQAAVTRANGGHDPAPTARSVVWLVAGFGAVAVSLAAIPHLPEIVIVGLLAYTAVALLAFSRVTEGGASPSVSRRRHGVRMLVAAIALVGVGLALVPILLIAAYVMDGPYGP